MTLSWLDYLVRCLANCADNTPTKASLNGSFMEDFVALNIISFADMAKRKNDRVLWDVRRVSSP